MTVPMMSTYCRRCHAAITSTASSCPLCGLSRPNYDKLSDLEKRYLDRPPNIPSKFESMVTSLTPRQPVASQLWKQYTNYIASPYSSLHKTALSTLGISLLLYFIYYIFLFAFLKHFCIFFAIFAITYLAYDLYLFTKSSYTSYMLAKLQMQGGTSPYSVHFKIETVLENSLKGLQSLLYAFYDKPWEEMTKQMEVNTTGEAFVQAIKAITAKIKKFSGLSLETLTLLWRNNVYAITSMPQLTYSEKITHLNLKIREAEAIILRYCWFRQLEYTHEFLESHIKGESSRSTDEERKYVIEGMQLGMMGPLTEPYHGNFETVPYELPFIMRFFWHQQLKPGDLPMEEITDQYPETMELFESIGQLRNLIVKLEEQNIINTATAAVSNYSSKETEITTEAGQIKRFQLYSQYLDIPKFQPEDGELFRQVDRLNAQIRV